jgi:hypothetical protein
VIGEPESEVEGERPSVSPVAETDTKVGAAGALGRAAAVINEIGLYSDQPTEFLIRYLNLNVTPYLIPE